MQAMQILSELPETTFVSQVPGEHSNAKGFYENCLLCGIILNPETPKRRKWTTFFLHMLGTRWESTAYVWTAVQQECLHTKGKETLALCMPCMHWTSRCAKQRQSAPRVKLLMDTFIEYTQLPGIHNVPDERIMVRIICSLQTVYKIHDKRYVNRYADLLPLWVLKTVVRLAPSMAEATSLTQKACIIKACIVRDWWVAHGRPQVLPNREITSLVRRELQNEIEQMALHASSEDAADNKYRGMSTMLQTAPDTNKNSCHEEEDTELRDREEGNPDHVYSDC